MDNALTTWMPGEKIANGFCVNIDAVDSCHKVPTVPLQVDRILGPQVVLIFRAPDLLELRIQSAFGVQYRTVLVSSRCKQAA